MSEKHKVYAVMMQGPGGTEAMDGFVSPSVAAVRDRFAQIEQEYRRSLIGRGNVPKPVAVVSWEVHRHDAVPAVISVSSTGATGG